jgi:hypothetical protein
MLQEARSYRLFVGIDVSARTCTVATMRAGELPSSKFKAIDTYYATLVTYAHVWKEA